MHSKRWVMLRIGAVAVYSSLIVTAHAQQPSTPPDGPQKEQRFTKAEQVETIVVTATKRQEDVTKIPLSVTVIGGEALEDQHITNFTDLTRSVPTCHSLAGRPAAARD